MKNLSITTAVAVISSFLCLSIANSASFDCAKAVTYSEVAICSNIVLSELDDELWIVFKKAREKTGNSSEFKQTARSNLKLRNSCKSEACIKNWLENSIKKYQLISNGDVTDSGIPVVSANHLNKPADVSSSKTPQTFAQNISPYGSTVLDGLVTLGATTKEDLANICHQRNWSCELKKKALPPNLPWSEEETVNVSNFIPDVTYNAVFSLVDNRVYAVKIFLRTGYFDKMLDSLVKKYPDMKVDVKDHVKFLDNEIEEVKKLAKENPNFKDEASLQFLTSMFYEASGIRNGFAKEYKDQNVQGRCGIAKRTGVTLQRLCRIEDAKKAAVLTYYHPDISMMIYKAEKAQKSQEEERKQTDKSRQIERLL